MMQCMKDKVVKQELQVMSQINSLLTMYMSIAKSGGRDVALEGCGGRVRVSGDAPGQYYPDPLHVDCSKWWT